MTQRIIDIEHSPTEFFGETNAHVELIKDFFPKIKIVARGNQLITFGQEQDLLAFEKKINQLIKYFSRYNKLNKNIIYQILSSPESLPSEEKNANQAILFGVGGKIIEARTKNQEKLVTYTQKYDMVFAVGPAGTGKTYTSVALAVRALKEKQVKRIILTRPAVEAGENLGFLPGDIKEKLDPYMQPLYDALFDMIPREKLNFLIETGVIQIAPLAFMRGRTLDNAFVILDEAQNTTSSQMKMFLTRMGQYSKFIITGDPGQIDLPPKTTSGLKQAIELLKNIKNIGVLHLDQSDIIRHPLVKDIVKAYDTLDKNN